MAHIVLLGDSIFDNAPYVPAGTEVQARLQSLVEGKHRVSLLARDGAVLADMLGQVARLPSLPQAADWLVLSCGGNDVLGLVGAMQSRVGSVIEAVSLLADWQAGFRRDYRRMLNVVLSRRKPVAVTTIYDGVPGLDPGLRTALAPFNDVILREAFAHRLPVLDLRLVCDEAGDYSTVSPIEPSAQGGAKIAAAIAQLVREQDPDAPRTTVYGGAAS
jgi:lysophospholipase L1-like esterase